MIAEHLGEDGYHVLSSFQGPFTLYPVMARALRVPGARLRLCSPRDSGGSFGVKQTIFPCIVAICLASRKARRPVKWIEDRLEHLVAATSATSWVTTLEAAVTGPPHAAIHLSTRRISKTVSPLQRLRSCRSVRTLIEIGTRIESWDVAGRLGAQASVAEAFGAHEATGQTGLAGRGAAGLGRLHHVAVEAGLSTGRHRTVSSRSRTAAVVPGSGASPERTRIASSGEPSRRQLVKFPS